MAIPGIDDHLLARELLRQQRLGLVHLQVGSDEHGIARSFSGRYCFLFIRHEAVVALARRPMDRQSEADCGLPLKVVHRVANFERLDRENRMR